jgi:hypothetical protein
MMKKYVSKACVSCKHETHALLMLKHVIMLRTKGICPYESIPAITVGNKQRRELYIKS